MQEAKKRGLGFLSALTNPPPGHSSAHGYVELVGKTDFARMLARKKRRPGTQVISRRLPEASGIGEAGIDAWREAVAKSIQRHETKILELEKKPRKPKRLLELQARAEILRKLQVVGYPPHATEVAAAMAYQYGLKQDDLNQALNRANTLNQEARGQLFRGSITLHIDSVKRNLLYEIHSLLHNNPRPFTVKEIALKLGKKPHKKERSKIITALGTLDLMSLTQKLPNLPTEGHEYVWIHSCHALSPATIPDWNLSWQVLQKLKQGTKLEDIAPQPWRGKGVAQYATIHKIITRLKNAGLVSISRKARVLEVGLTKYAQKLLSEQEKKPHLLPEIQEALLGGPRQKRGLNPRQRYTLENIVRWARARQAFEDVRKERSADEQKPTAGYREAASRTGEKVGYLLSVALGHGMIRKLSKKNRRTYLEIIRRTNPDMADFIEDYLTQHNAT